MAITSFKWWCFTFFKGTKANWAFSRVSEYKYSTASYTPAFKTWMYVPTCITLTVSVCSLTPDLTQASAHYSKDISSVIRSATVGWSEKYRSSNGGTLCKNIVPNICVIEHNWVIFTSICGSFLHGWTVFIIVCSFQNSLLIRCPQTGVYVLSHLSVNMLLKIISSCYEMTGCFSSANDSFEVREKKWLTHWRIRRPKCADVVHHMIGTWRDNAELLLKDHD